MRTALLSLLATCSLSVRGQTVTMQVTPDNPIVMMSDLKLTSGAVVASPWIRFSCLLTNSGAQTITVISMRVDATSSAGRSRRYNFPNYPAELQPGQSVVWGPYYASLVPASSTVYELDASVVGWVGGENEKKVSLELHQALQTR